MNRRQVSVSVDFLAPNVEVEITEDDYLGLKALLSTASSPAPSSSAPMTTNKIIVTCGTISGVLHLEHFVCPGIRENCIEVADAPGVLITPMDFTKKAEKEKQKDWKGAIKHEGKMLRTLMEYKLLNFHQHETSCLNKCHSRNYITAKNSDNPSRRRRTQKPPVRGLRRETVNNDAFVNSILQSEQLGDLMKTPQVMSLLSTYYAAENLKRQEEAEKQRAQKQEAIKNLLLDDPLAFWTQTVQCNLTNMVLNGMTRELGALAQNINLGMEPATGAQKISDMVQVLGMTDSLPKEMCGQFVLPTQENAVKNENVQESALSSRRSSTENADVRGLQNLLKLQEHPHASISSHDTGVLSSAEKVEIMLKAMY
ncbi:unnamed protein product [Caenorhabditis sp. 36 PRJEB53466]|nr:unnamed protein product [Caenorhabditis sp. 36 PRJEB53466]